MIRVGIIKLIAWWRLISDQWPCTLQTIIIGSSYRIVDTRISKGPHHVFHWPERNAVTNFYVGSNLGKKAFEFIQVELILHVFSASSKAKNYHIQSEIKNSSQIFIDSNHQMSVPLAHRFRIAELSCFVDNPVQVVLRVIEERYQYRQVDYSELYYYCSFDTPDGDDGYRRVHSWAE